MIRAISCLATLGFLVSLTVGCTTPARIEVSPDEVVFEEAGKSVILNARIFDQNGESMSSKGLELIWLADDTKNIRLSPEGQVTAVASGETDVKVEIEGTEVSASVPVRVKIPGSVRVSQEKLRLEEGQVKEDVWAEVRSEKGAYLEGYLPKWSSEDSSVVRVEPIVDSKRRQSWVKLTGLKRGTTHVTASFRGFEQSVRVAVFGADEEVNMAGVHISKKKEEDARKAAARKKKKRGRRIEF